MASPAQAESRASAPAGPAPTATALVALSPAATTLTPPQSPATDPEVEHDDSALAHAWSQRLSGLYASYGASAHARAAKLRELFAPRLRRFISLTNVSIDEVVGAIESFFLHKTAVAYTLRQVRVLPTRDAGTTLSADVEAQWSESCSDSWASEHWSCTQRAQLQATVAVNTEGKITSYTERPLLSRYKPRATHFGYATPHSHCEAEAPEHALVELTPSSVVEATGRWLWAPECGPAGETFAEFRTQGITFWALFDYTERVESEFGPALGGETLFERIE